MNILIEGGNLNPSIVEGTKNVVLTHAEELIKRGHKVYILTRREDEKNKIIYKKTEKRNGIVYCRYKKVYELPFLLIKIIKKEKIDLIHIFAKGTRPFFYLFFIRKILKIPIIFTLLGIPAYDLRGHKKIKKLEIVNKLVVSSKTIEKIIKKYVDNTVYLPYGINVKKFCPLKKSSDKRKIISLRFITKDLIDAFEELKSKNVEFILSARHMKKKQKQGFFIGIGKDYKLVGMIKDMPKTLGEIDVLIDLHPKNSFLTCASPPLLILEAMASGAAIISTDMPEIKEIITNGEEGILLKNNSKEEIIEATKKIFKNLSKYSKKSREKVVKNFDIKKIINKYEKLYQEFI